MFILLILRIRFYSYLLLHYLSYETHKCYYPFGTAFAENTVAEQGRQPYKYNGKELDAMHGLNMYNYSARHKDDWRFTTVDPMSEKYYSISPYAYCGNNPLKYIDPTGMDRYRDSDST